MAQFPIPTVNKLYVHRQIYEEDLYPIGTVPTPPRYVFSDSADHAIRTHPKICKKDAHWHYGCRYHPSYCVFVDDYLSRSTFSRTAAFSVFTADENGSPFYPDHPAFRASPGYETLVARHVCDPQGNPITLQQRPRNLGSVWRRYVDWEIDTYGHSRLSMWLYTQDLARLS